MKRSFVGAVVVVLALAACTPSAETPVQPTTAAPAPTSPAPTGAAPTVAATEPPLVEPASYPFTLDDFPQLDGSTAAIPLGSLLLQRLAGVPKAQADNLQFSTTAAAYTSLACGYPSDAPAAVILAYEPAESTKKELAKCPAIEYHPIGRDALVFLTNAANPVTSLTTAQYKDVYTGKVTNWSALGGANQPIVAYQRPDQSGSQALMRKYVMGAAPMGPAPQELVTESMAGLVDGVAAYNNSGNALGYSVYYYVKQMYAQPGIKLLGANGVQPSNATIADGSYPYVNDFYAVIRADEPEGSPARRVVAWLETPEGQRAVADAGYVAKR